ncbi:MAG: RHS repeat-associated core domain-containing protein [Anaerolineaceae bacterium]|nr:RHS repeat-associated core domain-containing protein [Anaerolineaceae bacterium]
MYYGNIFGEIRFSSGNTPTNYQYTGQLAEPEIGLSWYASRFYDPYLAHFVQPDSIIPGLDGKNMPTSGIAWDHYDYVGFNPISHNDPSGHDVDCGALDGQCKKEVALEKSQVIMQQAVNNQTKTSWHGLTTANKNILLETGWTQYAWDNSDIGGKSDLRNPYLYEDPAVYASIIIGAIGGYAGPPILQGLLGPVVTTCATTGDCSNVSSPWPDSWDGRQIINGITYSIHALDQMSPVDSGGRGVPPSVVENALNFGVEFLTKDNGIVKYTYDNVVVVWNNIENVVVTVIKTGH